MLVKKPKDLNKASDIMKQIPYNTWLKRKKMFPKL